jgi:hypothetical protein
MGQGCGTVVPSGRAVRFAHNVCVFSIVLTVIRAGSRTGPTSRAGCLVTTVSALWVCPGGGWFHGLSQ